MLCEPELDVFIVVGEHDLKLLQYFFLSYQLFFKIKGNIHLFVWRKEQFLIEQLDCPINLIVHWKDDVMGLVADDFRNQMYLKLISDQYVKTEWYWVVDADYLICAPLVIEDFIIANQGTWYYNSWLPIPEQAWRQGSEYILGCQIPYLFMEEPLYVFNRQVVQALRRSIDVSRILNIEAYPSEFIIYGAYANANHPEKYLWRDLQSIDTPPITYRINQRPPTYMELNPMVSLADIGAAKYCVFWSHWEVAEIKMRQFIVEAQLREFGAVKFFQAKLLYLNQTIQRLDALALKLFQDNLDKDLSLIAKELCIQEQQAQFTTQAAILRKYETIFRFLPGRNFIFRK